MRWGVITSASLVLPWVVIIQYESEQKSNTLSQDRIPPRVEGLVQCSLSSAVTGIYRERPRLLCGKNGYLAGKVVGAALKLNMRHRFIQRQRQERMKQDNVQVNFKLCYYHFISSIVGFSFLPRRRRKVCT